MARTYKPKAPKRAPAAKGRQAKYNRKQFRDKSEKYKSDNQNIVCSAYHIPTSNVAQTAIKSIRGSLRNIASVANSADFHLTACIAIDPRNDLFHSPSYSAYSGLFNETRCSAIYLDILPSQELRKNAQQMIILVEKGNETEITDINQMVSDVNHKMYMLSDTTNKITFRHVFATPNDKLFRKTTDTLTDTDIGVLSYLKIIVKGKNTSNAELSIGDLSIELRSKTYNQFRDMKVLTDSTISLNQ